MPTTLKVNYTSLNNTPLSESILRNTQKAEALAQSIATDISSALKATINLPHNLTSITLSGGHERRAPYDMYDYIYVDGIKVSDIVKQTVNNMDLTFARRETLGAVLVARAHVLNKKVTAVPFSENGQSKPIDIEHGGSLPKISPTTVLDWWEKFWSHFGFYKEKISFIEREMLGAVDAMSELHIENAKKNVSKIEANHAALDELHDNYTRFFDEDNRVEALIENQYTKNIDPALFDQVKLNAFKEKNGDKAPGFDCLPEIPHFTPRSKDTICSCMMLLKGHSLKEIADPEFTKDRGDIGQQYAQLISNLNSKDEKIKKDAISAITEIYTKSSQVFLTQPHPSKDDYANFYRSSESPHYLCSLPNLAKDFYEDMKNLKFAISQTTDISKIELDFIESSMLVVTNLGSARALIGGKNSKSVSSKELDKKELASFNLELYRSFCSEITNYANYTPTSLTIGYFAANNEKALNKVQCFDLHMYNNRNIINVYYADNCENPRDYDAICNGMGKIQNLMLNFPEHTVNVSTYAEQMMPSETVIYKKSLIRIANLAAQQILLKKKPSSQVLSSTASEILKSEEFKTLLETIDDSQILKADYTQQIVEKIVETYPKNLVAKAEEPKAIKQVSPAQQLQNP